MYQSFWYDHPIPLDASNDENEIIYGLENFDNALAFEVQRNNIDKSDKITLVLSVSVTHQGLEKIALKYIKSIIKKHLKLKHIDLFYMMKIPVTKLPHQYSLINIKLITLWA